jgi:type IV pilus assembly protein PilY1
MTYSIWDKQSFGSVLGDTVSESDLESIRIKAVTTGVDAASGATINAGGITNFYTVEFSSPSVTQINWLTKRGWKMALDVNAGQRVVYPVQMVGEVVKIDTVSPGASASACETSNSNAISFYINPLTAACRTGGTLDTNNDGNIDGQDANVCAYSSKADGMDVILMILDSRGKDTGLRDVQNSEGHIKTRVGGGEPPDCTDPAYAAAHTDLCPVTNPPPNDCTSQAYREAHPGQCAGSTLNRSWRQIFPRAN